MYLKSLTLKGFKSFASATTLKLEPGICAVVGPNGSGKSNVVDALAWVMGEQGAKNLRGGKMEDVIFAGAGERKALGRAEVTLTIDNSDGALPIEYSEVSVTRRMFRDGASEYEINGSKARLMDIQELLSDSGIGREMHVIVGQGRLAQILESKPEDRRAFIEEAAGVLKHRRRKEKAQRKLQSMQANVDRLHDLTDELARQLKPLARQAEAAQRAATVQARLRQARTDLAADKVLTLQEEYETLDEKLKTLSSQIQESEESVEYSAEEVAYAEEELRTALEEAESARSLWFRLSTVKEKTAATMRIAAERAAQREDTQGWHGQDPDFLLEKADKADQEQKERDTEVEISREALDTVREEVHEAEEEARQAEKEHLAQVRAIADRREGAARLMAQHDAARQYQENVEKQLERAEESLQEATQRAILAQEELEELAEEAELEEIDYDQASIDQAEVELRTIELRVQELRSEQRDVEKDIATREAQINLWKKQKQRAESKTRIHEEYQARGWDLPQLVAQNIFIRSGWERALTVVLGDAAQGWVAPLHAELFSSLHEGVASVLISPEKKNSWHVEADIPKGAEWLIDLIGEQCSETYKSDQGSDQENYSEEYIAMSSLLADVVAVPDIEMAQSIVSNDPRLRAVTKDGVLLGHGWVALGHKDASPVEVLGDIQQAEREVAVYQEKALELHNSIEAAQESAAERRTALAAAKAEIREIEKRKAQAQEHIRHAQRRVAQAEDQRYKAQQQRDRAEIELDKARNELIEMSDRVARIEVVEDREPSTEDRDQAMARLSQMRAAEMEARLQMRTAEERAESTRGRADSLRRQARQEKAAKERFLINQQKKKEARQKAERIHALAQKVAQRISHAQELAENTRQKTDAAHKQWRTVLEEKKKTLRSLESQKAQLLDSFHGMELAHSQVQVKLDQAMEQIRELGLNLDQLRRPEDFNRSHTLSELKQAEKDLQSLGRVNPLALEEFKALEERYTFLSTQLDDVERAREDLRSVIKDVDDTILQLFTDAWKDVEAEFPRVFSTLFPGGAGRLVLTEPDDMLSTGIEVEARPPGKKVKRLTLLSGGEKSLTALAMLVAIFRARPSPFYVMDEVEAALDDVNLRRLIALFEELRHDSQLIVITHQKPTMDIANVLYGVTMRGDGVTRVISQRMSPQIQ